MVTHRKENGMDGLATPSDHGTGFHSNEWNGALSSEPLNARTSRDELTGTPVSDTRREGFSTTSDNGSVKDKLHAVTDRVHEKIHSAKENIRPVVRQKVDSMRTPVRNKVDELRPKLNHKILQTKQSSREAVRNAKTYLRTHPAILPGVSAAIGLVVGMVARRALRRRKPLGVVVIEPKPGATAPVW
jgi:ElaB/YqjD/DUF883 family membrane-anchored ribosome-binding protein